MTEFTTVPVLENFKYDRVIGELKVRADALPLTADFSFGIAFEAAPNSAYKLVGVSAVRSPPEEDNREAWLTVISDLTAALTEERADNANLRHALEARAEDTFRLDWLAEQALRTPTAIEFEYTSVPAAPWRGYRVSGRDFIGPRMPTLRQAIDAALAESGI